MSTIRCAHCGGEYDTGFPSHCMANFHANARKTELLGSYVERAETAEARVAALERVCKEVHATWAGSDAIGLFAALLGPMQRLEHVLASGDATQRRGTDR